MKRSFVAVILACLLAVVGYGQAIAAATLLPPGQNCFQATTGTNGMVGTLGTITGGSGGTTGTYAGVTLTGGSGSGATATITVAGGAVTAVAILNPGTQYVVGDTLSAAAADIGNTTGFSVPVNSVSINSSLAGGQVYFYVPNTSTFKSTWSDAAQTVQNTNPVQLDQNGCAIIYGTGSYRQVLQDSLGNTVWDAVTADTSSYGSTPFWAGTAGGTPNAITVVDPGFNATDGSIINFVPLSTNTAATTLNPSSFGAISIVKDTTAGPVSLSGGEIVAATSATPNVVSVIYSATQNNFHLLNTVIASASGSATPPCSAVGLKIGNNTSTPNSVINITADEVVMKSSAGLIINRSNVSVSLNLTTGTSVSTANGMDGEAVSTSKWIDIFLIDNGAAAASLGSRSDGNGLTPSLPSGYTYKCRIGAMSVDGSSNLYRSNQSGNVLQYSPAATTNTPVAPRIDSGSRGSFSITSPTLTTVQISAAGFCPPTAVAAQIMGYGAINGSATASVLVAPDTNWGGSNNGPQGSASQVWPIYISLASATGSSAWMNLSFAISATPSIAWASSNTGGAISLLACRDNVNAN